MFLRLCPRAGLELRLGHFPNLKGLDLVRADLFYTLPLWKLSSFLFENLFKKQMLVRD